MRPSFSLPAALCDRRSAHFPPRFYIHSLGRTVGIAPAPVFHCAYGPSTRHNFFSPRVLCALPITALFSPYQTRRPGIHSTVLYHDFFNNGICSRGGLPKCGRITSKINDLRIGKGERSTSCPSVMVVKKSQPERKTVAHLQDAIVSSIFERVSLWWNIIEIIYKWHSRTHVRLLSKR